MAFVRPVTRLRAGNSSVSGSVYAEHTGSGLLVPASSTLAGTGNVSSQGGGDSLVHGEIFTLTGSGFGTREDYGAVSPNPSHNGTMVWCFNDFEAASIEGSTGWNFNSGGATHWEHVTGDPRHARSTKYARRFGIGNIQYLRAAVTHPSSSDVLFYSCWLRQPVNWEGKTFRYGIGSGSFSAENWWNTGIRSVTRNNSFHASYSGVDRQAWQRYDGYFKGRSSGTQDQKFAVIGVNSNNPFSLGVDTSEATRIGAGVTNPMLGAGSNATTGSSTGWHFDDLYVDFSLARIELANHADWSQVTYSELQLPVSWEDGEIQFRARCGAFTSGQIAWLHVVKEDGTRMAAVEVEIA